MKALFSTAFGVAKGFVGAHWIILAQIAAVIAVVTAAYFWAYNRGYNAHKAEVEAAIEKQREINRSFDGERKNAAATTARKVDQLNASTAKKVANEKARPLPAADTNCVRDNASSGMPGVPDAGASANACAAATDLARRYRDIAAENAGTAEQNADQVTALQSHIESSRREYNKTVGNKDDRPVSDAEKRFEARLKAIEARAERMEKSK